jgi:hypothetical protein
MDRPYSIHEGDEKCIQNFDQEIINGRDHLEDLGRGWRMILKWAFGK